MKIVYEPVALDAFAHPNFLQKMQEHSSFPHAGCWYKVARQDLHTVILGWDEWKDATREPTGTPDVIQVFGEKPWMGIRRGESRLHTRQDDISATWAAIQALI